MPEQPTREQFDAAAKKVLATAPSGLSKEQFYNLIDQELASGSFKGSYGMMSDAAAAGREHPEGLPDQIHEPDTASGGFLKSIKDQLSGLMPMLRREAAPTTKEDILPLLLPGATDYGRTIGRMTRAGVNGAKASGPGIKDTLMGFIQGVKEHAIPTATDVTGKTGPIDIATQAAQNFNREPLAKQMNAFPATEGPLPTGGRTSGPPAPAPAANPNDLPLYLQQALMEEKGAAPVSAMSGESRSAIPPHAPSVVPEVPRQMPSLTSASRGGTMPPLVPNASEAGRLAGKAPSLEETLQQALQDSMAGDPVQRVSGAPTQDITPGGATRQSGTFDKSESLGQSGGYTSGNPATGISKASPTKLDTTGWTKQDWADIRRLKGARDAGRLTGKTPEEVRQLSGGGPSQTPLEAEERIRNYDPNKDLK